VSCKDVPFPELVEGNMFAKGYRFFVGVKFFLPPQKIRPIRHPGLVSGAVDAVTVSFTTSTYCIINYLRWKYWKWYIHLLLLEKQNNSPAPTLCFKIEEAID